MKISNDAKTTKVMEFLLTIVQQHQNLLVVSKDATTRQEFADYLRTQVKQEVKVLQELMGNDIGERLLHIPNLKEAVVMQAFGPSLKTAVERLEGIGMSVGLHTHIMRQRLANAVDFIVYVQNREDCIAIEDICSMTDLEKSIDIEWALSNIASQSTTSLLRRKNTAILQQSASFQFQH